MTWTDDVQQRTHKNNYHEVKKTAGGQGDKVRSWVRVSAGHAV